MHTAPFLYKSYEYAKLKNNYRPEYFLLIVIHLHIILQNVDMYYA